MLPVNRGELMSGLKTYGVARTGAFRALSATPLDVTRRIARINRL
jgi:hypothetical protein